LTETLSNEQNHLLGAAMRSPRVMAILLALLLALLLQQQAQSQQDLLDLRPAKRRRTGPRRPGAWLIWSYNALFEGEFYPNYRMAKHKFAALV
jgi:hypothetical protein